MAFAQKAIREVGTSVGVGEHAKRGGVHDDFVLVHHGFGEFVVGVGGC